MTLEGCHIKDRASGTAAREQVNPNPEASAITPDMVAMEQNTKASL